MNVLEYNPSSIILNNGAYVASFALLVEVDGVRTWHYYGVPVPGETINGVATMQHDPIEVMCSRQELLDLAGFTAKDDAVAALVA